MTKIIAFSLDQDQILFKDAHKDKYSFFLCHGNQVLRTLELRDLRTNCQWSDQRPACTFPLDPTPSPDARTSQQSSHSPILSLMPVFSFFLDHYHQHRNLLSFLPFYNGFRNYFDYLSPFTFCLISLLSFSANLLKRLSVFPTPSSSSLLSDFASTQDLTHHSVEMPLLGVHRDISFTTPTSPISIFPLPE